MNEKKIEALEKDIETAKSLENADNMKLFSFIERMVSAWKDESFDIKSGLTSFFEYQELKNKKSLDYIDNIMKMNGPGAFLWKFDFERLKLNLEILKEELQKKPLQTTSKMTEQGTTININNNNINSNTNIITVTLSQTIQQLEQTDLTKEELSVIMQMLTELENLKGKKKDTIWEKVKKIMAWLADKTVDVGIAIVPYLLSALAKN